MREKKRVCRFVAKSLLFPALFESYIMYVKLRMCVGNMCPHAGF